MTHLSTNRVNNLHGRRQIIDDIVRLNLLLGGDLSPIARAYQHGQRSNPATHFDIACLVPDNNAPPEIKLQILRCLFDQSGVRFTAQTLVLRSMRAEVKTIESY